MTDLTLLKSQPADPLDRRRHAYRDDIAAESLRGRVHAPRYVLPSPMRITVSSAPLKKVPDAAAGYDSELVHGELIDVFERRDGWAWGQAKRDNHVGYIPESALDAADLVPTHRVISLRSFTYSSAGIKTTPTGFLPYGSEVVVRGEEGKFYATSAGFVYAAHLCPIAQYASDPVAEAERFLGIPYLWGGRSSLGLDCSGLVQTVCFACGIAAPRDSDMQERELGKLLDFPADPSTLARGSLLFWPGHVALAQGGGRMIHANAFHMMVQSEEITPALRRIEASGSVLRSVRTLL